MSTKITKDCSLSINNSIFFLNVEKMALTRYDGVVNIVDYIFKVGDIIEYMDILYAIKNAPATYDEKSNYSLNKLACNG